MDIVKRLREIGWSLVMGKIHAERSEAADEIERLRKEKGKMIDLLEYAADALHDVGSYSAWAAIRIALADFAGQENENDQV
jgi:NTP pyrophosphatase (non-canonical NTP hydrolase)